MEYLRGIKERELAREAFERFLDWLDADREQGGHKYEALRRGLIAFFNSLGCSPAEDLADETFNRAIRQLSLIEGSYKGDPARYLLGIARFVAREYFNRQVKEYTVPTPMEREAFERFLDSLDADREQAGRKYEALRLALPQTRINFYLFVSGLAGFILLSALTDQEEIVALGTLNIAIIGMWIWALLRKARTLTQSLTPPKGDAPEV